MMTMRDARSLPSQVLPNHDLGASLNFKSMMLWSIAPRASLTRIHDDRWCKHHRVNSIKEPPSFSANVLGAGYYHDGLTTAPLRLAYQGSPTRSATHTLSHPKSLFPSELVPKTKGDSSGRKKEKKDQKDPEPHIQKDCVSRVFFLHHRTVSEIATPPGSENLPHLANPTQARPPPWSRERKARESWNFQPKKAE